MLLVIVWLTYWLNLECNHQISSKEAHIIFRWTLLSLSIGIYRVMIIYLSIAILTNTLSVLSCIHPTPVASLLEAVTYKLMVACYLAVILFSLSQSLTLKLVYKQPPNTHHHKLLRQFKVT